MFRRRPAPARSLPSKRLLVEELEPRVLFSADAEAVLPGVVWQGESPAPQAATTLLVSDADQATTATTTSGAQASGTRHEVAFVDAGIHDAEGLIALLRQQADADGRVLDIVRLDPNADGISQVSDWLAAHNDLDAVHVFSHGHAGALQLGATVLDADSLSERAGDIVGWSQAFTSDGDLLLYGCDLAADDAGRQLLSDLSLLTGADVAASEDLTGAEALGGDWVLEQEVGHVESAVALGASLQSQWQGVLATLVVDTTADNNDTGLGTGFNITQLNANKGADGKVSLREAIIAANNTAGLDTVTFSLTGATGTYGEYTITLSTTLPTISDAIYLNGASQSGYTNQPIIVLDGNGGSGNGFTLNSSADGSTIRGFVIRDFAADGIHIDSGSDGHTIVGNFIGSFNADGSNAGTVERNGSAGIDSNGANVVIGGTTAADRNVISGNTSAYNIYLATGANGTIIQGNYIGTDAAGTSAFTSTNSNYGIMLETSASNVTIGGTAAGAGNVISGFSNRGVWVTTTGTVTVQGNKIGTDVTGTVDLGNTGYGLYVDDGGTVTIGGTAAGAGNLVSGNDGGGIYVGGSVTATVQGNIVGLNASGTAALGNTGVGIFLTSSKATTVGGSTAAARNVISGNSSHGIEVSSSPTGGHRVQGNHIGVGSDGVTLLGNGGAGVRIAASDAIIGGKNAGEGNVIAGNAGDGIAVTTGNGNLFYRNSIFGNGGLGIDLEDDGVTLNDDNDGDGGANYRTNFPVLTSVVTSGGTTRINGSIDWYNGGTTIYIEFFANDAADASGHGEGKTYLGAVQVTSDASGNASFSIDVSGVSIGQWVTAVANAEATYPGASEFALAVQAVAPANGPRGKLIWNNNDQFYQYYADWFGGSTGFGGTGVDGLSYGDDISMLAAAESPVREEIIFIGSADVSGKILAGVWDGQNWSSVLSIPIADPSDFSSQYNGFALAYDEVSGDAMLVWANGTTGTAGLSYATWNGTSWSSIQTITAPVSGEPVHMQLAAHPSSHEMILVAHTNAASNNEYAVVWNGSSWGNSQLLGTNTSRQFFELNVAYEKQSGQAMVVYDASASDSSAIQYRTWSGSSWSSEQTLSSPAGVTSTSELHTVVLVSDPKSDRLALAGKNAANQVWLQVWDGSSWDGGLLATSSGVTLTDHHATMALAFESQSGDLLAAYGTNTGPSVYYRTWTSGGGWSAQGTGPSMGGTDVPYVVKLYADPYSNTIMLGVQDNASDLNMVAWDGSGWGSVKTLDASTGFTYRENFTFVWYRDSALISDLDGDNLSYQEDAGAIVLDQGTSATLTMGGDAYYDGAVLTVSFASGSTSGEDVLGVRHQGSGAGQVGVSGANVSYGGVVIGTLSGGSGGTPLSITFNVNASDAAATAVLRNITYANTNTSTPDTTNRVVRFVVQSAQGHSSAYNEVTVQVQAVNDAPVNTVPGAQAVDEDGSLTFSSANGNRLNVSDADAASGNIEVQLSVDHGVLNVPGWSATTASSLTLTGTVAQLQSWLASVVYTPTAQYSGGDTLTMTTSDLGNAGSGGVATDMDTVTITVNAVNDAPVITSNGGGASASVSVNEGSSAVTTVTATDPDGDTLSYSIVGGADAGSFTINASTGALSFASSPDHEVPLDANGDNVYEVSVRVSDGTVNDTQAISVTVLNLNDNAPVITSNGGGASASVNQVEGGSTVTTVTATDADGDSLSYHIVGGADASRFQINSATGALTFVSSPDFESPTDAGANNVYDVVVEARDGVHTDTQAIAVTITDVNDNAPDITSNGGGATGTVNVAEGNTAVTTVTATDADTVGSLTYRIAGGADAGRFTINAATGALSFGSTPDFEAPADAGADNAYEVIVEADDGAQATQQTLTVNVTDANDNAPDITSNGGGASASINVAEGSTAVTTVVATDADTVGSLTYRIAGGADAGRFTINAATGALSFASTPDFEAPTDAGADNAFEVIVEADDGVQATQQTLTVDVTDTNDTAPDITSDGGGASASINVAEGNTSVTTVVATDADTVGSLTYRIAGGADAARFTINAATGALSFASTPDFEAPTDAGADNAYEVIVEADDGVQATQQTLTVNVTDANDSAPDITSDGGGASASINVAEGSTAVTTVVATDADTVGSLTYRIAGGADAGRFTINAATGALSFGSTPDFEAPTDAGTDNAYEVIVEADDGAQATQQTLTVNVTDANDNAPTITSDGGGTSANLNINENTTAVTTATATDGDSVGTLSWRIAGGADAARFQIDAGTGALSFVSAPDFEAPTDVGGDNVYDVVVEVSDGTNVDTQAIAVTVGDVFEVGNAPVITSDGGGASANLNINENTSAVTTVTATDVDGDPVSYRIAGGADAAHFQIDSGTGVLSFVSAPDFDAPTDAGGNNVYDVVVEVSDGISVDAQTISVTVGDLNDTAPDITSNGGGASASINAAEGSTAVTTVVATDADTTGSITYRIAGGADAARFTINAATGALSFASTPDFEAPTDAGADNAYEVVVEADDGVQATQQALTVNVTDLNDTAPDITSDGGGASASINVTEGNTAVTTVVATDADTTGSITYRIAGGADAARFTINAATGALSFANTPDFEAPTDAGADNAYEVVVEADDGVQATQQTLTVDVTDTNDTAPDITSDGGGASASVNVAEGNTAVTTVTATDADTTGSITYRIAGGADAARFTINAATGALSFASTPDFENPQDAGADNAYEVIVEADDGVQASQQTLTVNVTDANDNAPTITSDGGGATGLIQVDEGGTTVTTATASDVDTTGSLSWAIVGGADAGRFTIDATTGVLSFAQATDHEAPLDVGGDNVYTVRIQVSDGVQTSWQDLLVTVRDLNDNAPVVTSHAGAASVTVHHAENTQAFATMAANDADATSTLVWRISGGADAARFQIDAATGAMSFVTAPDHETPVDADADGTYEVTVEVDDGTQTDTQALSIVVDNVNENPQWSGAAPIYTTPSGTQLVVGTGGGLMNNAQDPDGNPVQLVLLSGPSRGSLNLSADGSFLYQPDAGFAGVDRFTVTLSDGSLQGLSRVIEVRVEAPASLPDAVVRNPDPAPAPVPAQPSAPPPAPEPDQAPAAPAPVDSAPNRAEASTPIVDGLGLLGPADPSAWLGRAAPAAGEAGSLNTTTASPADNVASGVSLRIEAGVVPILVPVDSPLVAFSRLLQATQAAADVAPGSVDLAVPAIDLGGFMGWPPDAGDDEVSVDVKIAQAGGAALSAGAVWWAARTSGLLASMAISAPVWRGIDPLPVLGGGKPRDDELPDAAAPDAEGDIDHVFDRQAATPLGSDIALGAGEGAAR